MHVLIHGAGGVGGYYGARLAEAGYEVTFVARGRHRAAMEELGLTVRSQRGDVRLTRPRVVGDPGEAPGTPDVALVCVKLWDTGEAALSLAPLAARGTAVVSLQNGIDKEETLAGHCGQAAVMGGTTQIGAAIAEPGVIQHTGTMATLIYGELDGADSERLRALDAALTDAAARTGGFEAQKSDDVRRELWRKFSVLAPFAGLTSYYRSPIGPLRDDAQARAQLDRLARETAAVGRAAGANLPADRADEVMAFVDGLPAEMKSSMLVDLEQDRPLELDWLTGAVVRLGKRHGVATPESQVIYDALKPYKNG